MPEDVRHYIETQDDKTRILCEKLYTEIRSSLPDADNKIWHGHPVWFLAGNPIVGFDKQKAGLRLMFWSGASFDEPLLNKRGETFKDASIIYNEASEVDDDHLARWLEKSRVIQWNYKNIIKNKGKLERLV